MPLLAPVTSAVFEARSMPEASTRLLDSRHVLRLTLIRHALTDWNASGRFQGVADVELNAEGRQQARRLARYVAGLDEAAHIYSSPLKRAVQTAELAFPGRPLDLDSRLKEINFGEFEGKTQVENEGHVGWADWLADPFERVAPGDWQRIAYVKASNTDAGDEFGSSVAFAGDTVVAGAPFEDSVLDATGDIDALDVFGAYFSYRHVWGGTWRSNFTLGYTEVDNDSLLTGFAANQSAQSARVNLLWSPVPKFDVGFELSTAKREIESGDAGEMNRIDFMAKYSF